MKRRRYKKFKSFLYILTDFLRLLHDFIVNFNAGLLTGSRLAPCVIFILYSNNNNNNNNNIIIIIIITK